MTGKRKEYEEKFDAQLKEWSAQITLLNVKADKASAEMKLEYYKTIENLQGKQDTARRQLRELRTARDDAWEDINIGAENVRTDVKNAFNRAILRFA